MPGFLSFYKSQHGIGDNALANPSQERSFLDYYEIPVFLVGGLRNFFISDFIKVDNTADGSEDAFIRYAHIVPNGDSLARVQYNLNNEGWIEVSGDTFGNIEGIRAGDNILSIREYDVENERWPPISRAYVIRFAYLPWLLHTSSNILTLDGFNSLVNPVYVDANADDNGGALAMDILPLDCNVIDGGLSEDLIFGGGAIVQTISLLPVDCNKFGAVAPSELPT
jgi:hypothetical protein